MRISDWSSDVCSSDLEERVMQRRGFSLPRERGGLLCGTYALVPEIGAKFIRMFDACQSPKTAPAFLREEELAEQSLEADPRTPEQLRHELGRASCRESVSQYV